MIMTLTIYWWYLPILLFIVPIIITQFIEKSGDYDFVTPLLCLATYGICWMGSLGIIIGHFLK